MSILSDIITGVISPITNTLTAIVTKKDDVKLEMYKVDGKVDLSLVAAHVSILQAQAGLLNNKWMVRLQVAFGGPLAFYYGKVIVWDKALGSLTGGHTDPLDGYVAQWSLWIVSFLFLHSAITTWTRKT
jgi:hypothetical protein